MARIRLGFIGNSKLLENCATDKTVSIEALSKVEENEKKIARLKKVAKNNIFNTLRILENNKKLGIKVYGMSPKIFPLANYPNVEYFRYIDSLKKELCTLGEFIKENDFRVDIYLGETVILNSLSERLYDDAIKNIKYQNVLLNSMGLDEKHKIIVNFGGTYINKHDSIDRFRFTLNNLDEALKKRLIVNNEDNFINANEILDICEQHSIPYFLNADSEDINNEIIQKSLRSWEKDDIPALFGLRSNNGIIKLSRLDKDIDVIIYSAGKDANILKNKKNEKFFLF